MPNNSVNIEKHTKTYTLNTCVVTENAKLRKIKQHKHLRQLTRYQLQLHTIIIMPLNTFKRILLVINLFMTATYVIDYGKKVHENSDWGTLFPRINVENIKIEALLKRYYMYSTLFI
jgi:hypothetical protein